MNVPVIFIHKGNQEYFQKAIVQAKKNDNQVIVIDDNLISNYSQKANEFSNLYEHLSTNNKDIELLCFNRWFILNEFMVSQNIDRCLYLDSDVMLYANVDNEIKKFEQFDFTLSHRCCGSNSFFTLRGLTDFCDFLITTYSNKNSYDYEKISSHYYIRQKHGLPGGVCDMSLLEYHAYQKWGLVGEMMHIIDGSTYDHNINTSDQNFKMSNLGIKEIVFSENIPYGYQCSTGKTIRFNTLHYQGNAKRFL
jgi:hypothetical protein